jgi:hypothetical protein
MPFDQHNHWVRSLNFNSRRLQGLGAEAVDFDTEFNDMAAGLDKLMFILLNTTASSFIADDYLTKAEINARFTQYQPKLTYVPINPDVIGEPGGIAPIGVDGKIPDEFLPAAQTSNSDVASFNGRQGAVTLSSSDIALALGYLPDQPGSTRTIAQIPSLQAALDGKQASIGYTPINAATINQANGIPSLDGSALFPLAKVNGLSAELATLTAGLSARPVHSIDTTSTLTDFPITTTLLVEVLSPPVKRSKVDVYAGILSTDSYNISGAGTKLSGKWVCNGHVGTIGFYERVE